jgi:hypothetical protein
VVDHFVGITGFGNCPASLCKYTTYARPIKTYYSFCERYDDYVGFHCIHRSGDPR